MDIELPREFWFGTAEESFQHNRRVVQHERNEQIFPGVIDTQYDYLTPYLKEWASSPSLRLIVVDYPILEEVPLRGLCVDLVELFKESDIPIVWLMREPGPLPKEPPTTTDLVQSLISQIMQLPQFPKQATFKSYLDNPQAYLDDNMWLALLTQAIAKLENIVIVIDSSLLRCGRPRDCDQIVHRWISQLLSITENHPFRHWRYNRDNGIYAQGYSSGYPAVGGVKVVIAGYDCDPRSLQPTSYRGQYLYVDITQSFKQSPQLSSQDKIVARQTVRVTGKKQLAGIIQLYGGRVTGGDIKEHPSIRPHPDEANEPPSEPIGLSAQKESPTSSNSEQYLILPPVDEDEDEADRLVEASPTSSNSEQSLIVPPVDEDEDEADELVEAHRNAALPASSHSTQPSTPLSQDNIGESTQTEGKRALPIISNSNNVNKGSGPQIQLQGKTFFNFAPNSSQPLAPFSHSSQPPIPSSQNKVAELVGISARNVIPTSSNTECISHRSAASVSDIEFLFDTEEPSAHAAKRANDWFRYFTVDTVLDLPEGIIDKEDRIRIAVLDTGIDMGDKIIHMKENRERITYRSFVTGDQTPTVRKDLVGHGTHVAGLLLQVAQNADIFVAKVSDKGILDEYDPQDIANAIRYAVDEWHVHIINMSFGFRKFTEELDCIKRAIIHADSKGTVLFAAARNNGGAMEIAYPASRSDVICINSTDGHGNPSPFNPTCKAGKDFSTLGEGVLSHIGRINGMSGTSFAAPIAAGMAAVVMDYLAQKSRGWGSDDIIRRKVAERIKTKDGIVEVFDKHFCDRRGGFKFLFPWKFFKKDGIGLDSVLLNTLQSL